MNDGQEQLNPRIQAYLDRIGFVGEVDRNASTLAALQECHLHAVPYENLDILRGIPLSLEIDDLFDKIVTRRRGGFCFELNALFGWLLQELGFTVTSLFARFWRDEPNPPPKRRHQVLRVGTEDGVYLCDVGVGGIVPRRPIRMVEHLEHQQGEECYRLERDLEFGWVLCERKRGNWSWLYSFTEESQFPKDYITASFWCENAPESIFRRSPMVAIRTKDGRNTIAGKEFRIFTAQGVHTFTPQSDDEYRGALRTYFGIVI